MNQQRSRRFRSAQEAKDKEDAHKKAIAVWEGEPSFDSLSFGDQCASPTAMGKTVSEDEKNKTAWDSNAITPGTPFMDLLANSLRYWVVLKMNSDPGWKDVSLTSGSFALTH